jgi:hypothetical protein
MSGHTPEPWVSRAVVDRHDFNATAADVQGPHGEFVADCGSHEHATANGRRIVSCVNALAGVANPEAVPQMIEALRKIEALKPEPFTFPADWQEQIARCPECQDWKARKHPFKSICDEHSRPLWARDSHDEFERKAIGSRARLIARDALAALGAQ